jgi:RNA polymerase sigma-70 factor (ECF subfamily)
MAMDAIAVSRDKRDKFAAESVKFMDSLYRNALALVRNREDAEDLVQETFVKAFRYYETYQTGTNLKAWLMKIQYNTFLYRYRRSALERNMLNEIATEPASCDMVSFSASRAFHDAEGVALSPIVKEEIDAAMREMPEESRVIVALVDVEGLKYKEIAEVVGIPIGTVMSRIHRARSLLRTHILNGMKPRAVAEQRLSAAA